MGRADTDIDALRALIAKALGRSPSLLEPIPAGLGHRHFFRLHFDDHRDPRTLIARVEPEGPRSDLAGQEPDLEPIRAFLEQAGLPVPRSYAHAGPIQILEDLGDESLERLASESEPEKLRSLYAQACSLIPRLQRLAAPSDGHVEAFRRQWDHDLVAGKARKWLDWSFPLLKGRAASTQERRTIGDAFHVIAERCRATPLRLAHRDFKAANLHRRPGREEDEWVMIDLQGAFLAPPEYDLVCLLRDAHVALPEHQIDTHLREIRLELPDRPDEESFMKRFDMISLTRVSKDLSHYLHAATHRGDRRYLTHVPQALANLKRAAQRLGDSEPDLIPFLDAIKTLPLYVHVPEVGGN